MSLLDRVDWGWRRGERRSPPGPNRRSPEGRTPFGPTALSPCLGLSGGHFLLGALNPGHHFPQLTPDLFNQLLCCPGAHFEEFLPALTVLIHPFLREPAILNLSENLLHGFADVRVNHHRPAGVVAVFSRVAHRVAH